MAVGVAGRNSAVEKAVIVMWQGMQSGGVVSGRIEIVVIVAMEAVVDCRGKDIIIAAVCGWSGARRIFCT